jgi:hypothetical protein
LVLAQWDDSSPSHIQNWRQQSFVPFSSQVYTATFQQQ